MHKSYLLKTYSLVQVYFYLDHLRWSFDTEKDLSGMDLCQIFQNAKFPDSTCKDMQKMCVTGYGEIMEDIKRKVSFPFGHCLN